MVNLGDEVIDRVSGFQGVAASRHIYLNGCDRVTVQPPCDKDGKLPKEHTFDELQLEMVKSGVAVEEKEKETGGPDKFMDEGR